MLKIKHTYNDISEEIKNPETENSYLNKQAVLDRMIRDLPQTPWANIEILDWLPNDDKIPIEYHYYNTSFGKVLAANTFKGICYLGLAEDQSESTLSDFKQRFKHSQSIETGTLLQKQVVGFLNGKTDEPLQFHLRGTPYQTEVWRKLIRIPYGKVVSYATLGGNSRYSRAAGAANSRNPIFWIVPCQRVVKATGEFDRYFWGKKVKKQLLAWEFANRSI